MEAGPLAEVAVPGLERLCGCAVRHDVVNAGPDLLHLREVRDFDVARDGIARCVGVAAHDRKLAGDARPRVGNQILLGLPAGGEDLKILNALALPSRL